jgi:hypothetical protein
MTMTFCRRADVLLARAASRNKLSTRFRAALHPLSPRLRVQARHSQMDTSAGPPAQPPPPPKGTDAGDQPGGHTGSPYGGFFILLFCVFMALFTPRATALESLPISDPKNSEPVKMGGAREGVKDDIETIRRLLRDLFMEQLSLRKRQDAIDQPSQQLHSLVDNNAASALRRRWKSMQKMHTDAVVTIAQNLELQGGCANVDSTGEYCASSLHTGPRLHSFIHSQLDSDTSISLRTMSSQEGISLWQAQLKRVLMNKLTILMSPVGARFKDIAQSLHASAGKVARTSPCMETLRQF